VIRRWGPEERVDVDRGASLEGVGEPDSALGQHGIDPAVVGEHNEVAGSLALPPAGVARDAGLKAPAILISLAPEPCQ